MPDSELASRWADEFGLAIAPLFREQPAETGSLHHVLLDGGFGSFALSVSETPTWQESSAADWCWSSNLPHHVTVTSSKVTVVRWDKPSPEVLTFASVEKRLPEFYQYLVNDRV